MEPFRDGLGLVSAPSAVRLRNVFWTSAISREKGNAFVT